MSERGLDLGRGDRFALFDLNSFYVSCERAFDPKLEGRPVMVLCARLDSVQWARSMTTAACTATADRGWATDHFRACLQRPGRDQRIMS